MRGLDAAEPTTASYLELFETRIRLEFHDEADGRTRLELRHWLPEKLVASDSEQGLARVVHQAGRHARRLSVVAALHRPVTTSVDPPGISSITKPSMRSGQKLGCATVLTPDPQVAARPPGAQPEGYSSCSQMTFDRLALLSGRLREKR